MSQTEKARLDAANTLYCVYRILFLMKMLDAEVDYLKGRPANSGLKNALAQGAKNYGRVCDALRREMPTTCEELMAEVNASDDKIAAMANILNRLSHVETEVVLEVEEKILENIVVQETEDEPQAVEG